MPIELRITGDVVERNELLNGTQTIVLEASDETGAWRVSGDLSWNRGLLDYDGEGAWTLEREDGAELYAVATRVEARPPDESGAEVLAITWDIDGGAGEFQSASGAGDATLTMTGESISGRCSFVVEADGSS